MTRSSPKEMVLGGLTEKVMLAGGNSLFNTLAAAAGGQRVDTCVYAATRLLSNVALSIDDLETARRMLRQVAEDAVSELELNWPHREQLLASAATVLHHGEGHA